MSIDDLAGILGTRFVFGWIKSVEVYWVRIAWRVKGNIGVFLSKALYGVLGIVFFFFPFFLCTLNCLHMCIRVTRLIEIVDVLILLIYEKARHYRHEMHMGSLVSVRTSIAQYV